MWFHIRNFNSCFISGNASDLKTQNDYDAHDKGGITPQGWRIIQTEKEQQAKSRFCMNDVIFNGRQVCAQLGNSVYAIYTVSGMWHCGPCQVGLLLKTFKHNVTSKVNALNHPWFLVQYAAHRNTHHLNKSICLKLHQTKLTLPQEYLEVRQLLIP